MLTDKSIMYASYESRFSIINIYVNDLLIKLIIINLIKKIKTALCNEFDIHDLKETRIIINMRIIRYKTKKLLTFN